LKVVENKLEWEVVDKGEHGVGNLDSAPVIRQTQRFLQFLDGGTVDTELEDKCRTKCHKMFGKMDSDQDGVITKDDLVQFYVKSGADPNDPNIKKKLDAQFAKVDVNGNGKISLVEFEKQQIPVMMKAAQKAQKRIKKDAKAQAAKAKAAANAKALLEEGPLTEDPLTGFPVASALNFRMLEPKFEEEEEIQQQQNEEEKEEEFDDGNSRPSTDSVSRTHDRLSPTKMASR